MKFSLREKATDDYKAFYGKYLDAVQNLNVEVYTEFNNELKKTKYDKLQREISEIMDNYNNTVVGDIENGTFSAWKESNSSLCACLKMYQAGDKANEVCIGIEKEMGNMMQENLKIVKEDPVNTAEPIISDEGLENLENKCVAAQTEIQNIKSQFVADLDSKIAENEIYGTLKPLFEDVAKKLEAFFSDSLKRFKDLHEFVNEKASQTNSKAEESVSRVSSGSETSQNAANGAGGISGGSGINNGVASSLAGGDSAMGDVEATGQEASADAGEEGEQEESANPSEEAEQETSVEPGEATEQESVVEPVEESEQEAAVEPIEATEQEESANPSEEAEQETSVEPGEATEQEVEAEPREATEQEAVVEPVEESEQEAAAEPTEEAEHETNVEPSETTEREVEAEPREATEQESVVEPVEELEQEAEAEPIETTEQESVVEPVEESEQEAAAEPTEEAEHETNVEPSETTEREVEAEPREATEQESVVEPVEELEQEAEAEPIETTEQESVVEPIEESEQESEAESSEATEHEESVNPSEEAEQETSVEPGEATEQEAEPREATEQESVVEPVEESEQEAEAEPIVESEHEEATEQEESANPSEEAEQETNVELGETTEHEVGGEPREATEQGSVAEPRETSERGSVAERREGSEPREATGQEESSEPEIVISFDGEKFSDENIKWFVKVVELLVNQIGVDELNSSVANNYPEMNNCRKIYSIKASKGNVSRHNNSSKSYGKYKVTQNSIQNMAMYCSQANAIFDPLDKFYKEKFEKLGKGFDKANKVIHDISSFCGKFGLGTWDLKKLFEKDDSDESILKKIKVGDIALSNFNTAGMIVIGGSAMLKVFDWAMPHLKKSKTLVKLNEKVWNCTREDIQTPYINRMMDMYMMEHYELKYGMNKGQTRYFEYLHNVVTTIDDDQQRRTLENAMFSAYMWLTPQHYTINVSDQQKMRAIYLGLSLNLIRSGMCSNQHIDSETSNSIVDKLYNIYVTRENIKPRVDINPDNKILK